MPRFFGEEAWVMGGEVCLRTEDDIREAVFDWQGWDLEDETHHLLYSELDGGDIEDILENNYRKVNIDISHTYDNVFFTYKAYEEHLRQNKHNLNNPKSYLFHAFRNPEMDMLFKFLTGLTS